MLSNTGGTNNDYGITRNWGVDGGVLTPDFPSGYANKSLFKVDLVNVGSGDLNIYFGIPYTTDSTSPLQNCFRIYKGGGSTSSIDFEFREASGIGGALLRRVVSLSTSVADSALYTTYELQFYDGAIKGSPWTSFEWEWKVLIGGTVVAESMTGTNRNHGKMSIAYNTINPTFWCDQPKVSIYHPAALPPGIVPATTWDNLAIAINGNDSCLPTAPPI